MAGLGLRVCCRAGGCKVHACIQTVPGSASAAAANTSHEALLFSHFRQERGLLVTSTHPMETPTKKALRCRVHGSHDVRLVSG